MIGVTITVNQNFQMNTAAQANRAIQTKTAQWLARTAVPLANAMVDSRLRAEPGRPRYPLAWASEKQRRYVMAKLRRQGNLPYRRTHGLVKAWEAVGAINPDGGTITAHNPAGMAGYVYAPFFQQPFHAVTGWMDVTPRFILMRTELSDRLITDWPGIVRGSVMR